MSAVFVTATGTDIGKSFVARGLIRALHAQGRTVDALKPIVSGYDPAHADASDPGLLLAELGRPAHADEIGRIAPWRFAAPLSPDMAAHREGRAIDFDALVAFCRKSIAAADTLVIEGVGGVMVPLDNQHTVLDWMAALDLPVVLIAGSYLGTLSHTLTAVDVLVRRKIPLAALVVSETPGSTVALADTVETLRRFLPPTPLLAIPRSAEESFDSSVFHQLAALV
jgi:dethiobiotin synthetase